MKNSPSCQARKCGSDLSTCDRSQGEMSSSADSDGLAKSKTSHLRGRKELKGYETREFDEEGANHGARSSHAYRKGSISVANGRSSSSSRTVKMSVLSWKHGWSDLEKGDTFPRVIYKSEKQSLFAFAHKSLRSTGK